ncbi:MAG: 4-(cytidine 5'-diphospho)-2-C-methyl-D-erythritol kinase [Lachnospiraceae bacterium]|nr:4-(cytidine 5'-diphospho)-2-C-methyl-D-erythritol kinase [Lachnospiraceae bacterium]
MILRATAKINLALDVVRKREDGYHEVRMIMQMIGMYDRLEIDAVSGKPGISLSTNLPFIPTDQGNLVYRAADLLMQDAGVTDGVRISLEKFIPVAAGLAGGSSDAAQTLIGINQLFRLGYSREKLMALGKKIGADVPYCVMQGTALAEGIGEILTPLPGMPACSILICKPNISVSTKMVYENLHANSLTEHPDVDGMTEAIKNGDLDGITGRLDNVLETVTVREFPIIETIKQKMKAMGAENAIMSGSGPTVFGIFKNEKTAEACRDALRQEMPSARTFLTWPQNAKNVPDLRD